MTSFAMNKTNRFWQQCQRFDFAQRNEHEIKTDRLPQAGGSAA